jgi:hypothetical protein
MAHDPHADNFAGGEAQPGLFAGVNRKGIKSLLDKALRLAQDGRKQDIHRT